MEDFGEYTFKSFCVFRFLIYSFLPTGEKLPKLRTPNSAGVQNRQVLNSSHLIGKLFSAKNVEMQVTNALTAVLAHV